MIRISKRLWGYTPEIHIAGIRCTQGNIAKVAGLFESRFLSVTIEPISADSRFMTCLRELIRSAELFAAGLTDMVLCVAFDECTIDIAMDRALHPRDIYRKLRALQFE